MTTDITPRLQRAIDFAQQELFAIDSGYAEALMSNINVMRQDDYPEPHLTVWILECTIQAIKVDTVDKLSKDLRERFKTLEG